MAAGTEQLLGRGHTTRCLCCYLPLVWVLLSLMGQVVIEDIVAPDVNLVSRRGLSTQHALATVARVETRHARCVRGFVVGVTEPCLLLSPVDWFCLALRPLQLSYLAVESQAPLTPAGRLLALVRFRCSPCWRPSVRVRMTRSSQPHGPCCLCAEHDQAPPRDHDSRCAAQRVGQGRTLGARSVARLMRTEAFGLPAACSHHKPRAPAGIISTGLEMWKGRPCAPKFRERIWGESIMLRKMLLNPRCWLQHMALNETTGALQVSSPRVCYHRAPAHLARHSTTRPLSATCFTATRIGPGRHKSARGERIPSSGLHHGRVLAVGSAH